MPRIEVQPAPLQPYRYGLMSVLSQPAAPEHWQNGVWWQTDGCAQAQLWPDLCADISGFDEKIIDDDGRPFDEATAVTIYGSVTCKLIQLAEARRVAAARLTIGEPRALERAFWAGEAGNIPALATGGPEFLGSVAGITCAVSLLEQALRENYGGTGIIHAPPMASPFASESYLIERDGAVLRTQLGTLWAFGGGYDPTVGPVGEAAPTASQTYLYATGAMTWRHEVEARVYPPDGTAMDRTTNEVKVLAERTHLLTRDCYTAAVLVDLCLDLES